ELRTVYASMVKQHPEAYSAKADSRIDVVRLRDQLTSRARSVLLVLLAAALLLAYLPPLPSSGTSQGLNLAASSLRITGGTKRRLRIFAVTQIAASFVLLAGASMLLQTLLALQAAKTGVDTRQVLAMNVPVMSYGKSPGQVVDFYRESIRQISA